MWDLESIVRQNNQAALDWMMRGKRVAEAQAPLPANWPLTVLAEKLHAGPPLIAEVCNILEGIDAEASFLELISVLLPENVDEIMNEPRRRRVYRFAYLFGEEYFPLPLNTDCGTSALMTGMPVELMAMSYSAYHELDMRPGYLQLLSLVIYPYEGDWRDDEDDEVPFDPMGGLPKLKFKPRDSDISWLRNLVEQLAVDGVWVAPMGFSVRKVAENRIVLTEAIDTPEVRDTIARTIVTADKAGIEAAFNRVGRSVQEKINGARVPLITMVGRMVGAETASLIPAAGWQPEVLRWITGGTPYNGVGDFADWVCSQTGCVVLDSSYDNVEFMEGMGEPVFKWTRHNVAVLTDQWPKVQQIRGNIEKLVDWLEADQVNNFRELLDFILKGNPKNKELTEVMEYDPLEHMCELDIVHEEVDEDDDGID